MEIVFTYSLYYGGFFGFFFLSRTIYIHRWAYTAKYQREKKTGMFYDMNLETVLLGGFEGFGLVLFWFCFGFVLYFKRGWEI